MQSLSAEHPMLRHNELRSILECHTFKRHGEDYLQLSFTVSSYPQCSNYSKETTLPRTDLNRHFNRGEGFMLSLDRYHSNITVLMMF